MTEKLEIYPKTAGSFFAVPFVGKRSPGLEQAISDMDLVLSEEDDGKWYVDGNEDHETAEIKSGYYFVRCGPFWDVYSPTELMDDFRIG